MGLLAWLGLKPGDEYAHLDVLVAEIKRVLPDAEPVVRRYIAIVTVLLAKVAFADGRFDADEEAHLRAMLSRVDKIPPQGIDTMCAVLRGEVPSMSEEELSLCYREMKALCDAKERVDVVVLLGDLASSDGAMTDVEEAELRTIAHGLGVPAADVDGVVRASRGSVRGARRVGGSPRAADVRSLRLSGLWISEARARHRRPGPWRRPPLP